MYLVDEDTRKVIRRELDDLDDRRQKGRMTLQLEQRHGELKARLELDQLAREQKREHEAREEIRRVLHATKAHKAELKAQIRAVLDVAPGEMLEAARKAEALDCELKVASIAEGELKRQLLEQSALARELNNRLQRQYSLVQRLSQGRLPADL